MSAIAPRRALAVTAMSLLLLGAASAQASDATDIALRAGFLFGHAFRCGVSDARLKASAAMVNGLIAAYSLSGDDELAARSEFIEHAAVSAGPMRPAEAAPSCDLVRAQLARFERHYRRLDARRAAQ